MVGLSSGVQRFSAWHSTARKMTKNIVVSVENLVEHVSPLSKFSQTKQNANKMIKETLKRSLFHLKYAGIAVMIGKNNGNL
jgi:hypothetical protein